MNQRFSITPANAATDLRLSDSVHRTLTVIGIFGDKNGWCWPSQSTLADLRGVSRKTINLHIKELIALGYLNIAPRYDEETGAQKSNMMQIKFDFSPDVTGGVTPKRLQGGGSPEGYTPHNTQEVTHNAPLNASINDKNNISKAAKHFESLTGFYPPHDTTDQYKDKWLTPLMAIMGQAKDSDEVLERIEHAVNASRNSEKGYVISSPKSIMTWALSYKPVQKMVANNDGSVNI